MKRLTIGPAPPEPEFLCPYCAIASHNVNDAQFRYCGACGVFVDDPGALEVARHRAEAAVVAAARKLDRAIGTATSVHMTEHRRAVKRLESIIRSGRATAAQSG